ncbi:uncharacterized protein LOC116001088 [Ipomoea triloba]|uniref:uncharacterized protein LOC116001088 n=1 Tax=Ipomoea triloba TaxID=35885 RepID=UPI00125E7175|nr:uncharacterized protein LOC116001088 [Ipomoea triloba]
MNKGKGIGTSKQFRWTKPMEGVFLQILAEEANNPNNPTNNFRSSSFNRVASTISEQFNVACESKHVENHLKIVKNTWMMICKLKNLSGVGWEDSLKMITCDSATYMELISATPKYETILNRKIEYYDEMSIVVGRDCAVGRFAKSFADIELESTNEVDDITPENLHDQNDEETRGKTSVSTATSSQKSGRKRKSLDLKVDEMAKQLGNIASAIKSLSTSGIDESELYQQVMTIGADFHEDDLCKAFEFLMTNEVQARIFKVKSSSLKRKWIESFISSLS